MIDILLCWQIVSARHCWQHGPGGEVDWAAVLQNTENSCVFVLLQVMMMMMIMIMMMMIMM